ncbi:precorrin-6A reductase [Veillonella rodentium]|uniref:Precorrin-6A reductase n=2 Tax=root TaxID=1 RepID=A0A239ZC33_9FIRM|nr:precorrin-6A reductase [Veillonella rodentium]SNV68563.1 Precorrin-6A reductase [Veillonella rodentium]
MIWVIAGTLDGRTLAVDIQERTGEDVLVTVVSQYGAELAAHKGITVHTGRLDQQAMQNLIAEHDVRLLIDASHPYAAIVTSTAQDAAKAMDIPFVRFERKEVPLPDYDKLHIVTDEAEAANMAGRLAKENNGHIYLTTGSKTMHIFAKSEALRDCEVWTRILPTAEVLTMMEDLKVSPKRIVAVQGPFSYDMNRIMFHDTKASVVVMKNSGLVGGADTKLQAAMDLNIHVIVIDRPRVTIEGPMVSSNEEFFNLWEDTNGLRKKS